MFEKKIGNQMVYFFKFILFTSCKKQGLGYCLKMQLYLDNIVILSQDPK